MKIFIPTIHKNNMQISNQNIIFGSINYDAQIATLLSKSNANIAIFSDGSALSSNPVIIYTLIKNFIKID